MYLEEDRNVFSRMYFKKFLCYLIEIFKTNNDSEKYL